MSQCSDIVKWRKQIKISEFWCLESGMIQDRLRRWVMDLAFFKTKATGFFRNVGNLYAAKKRHFPVAGNSGLKLRLQEVKITVNQTMFFSSKYFSCSFF
jgi:hypothetical protein